MKIIRKVGIHASSHLKMGLKATKLDKLNISQNPSDLQIDNGDRVCRKITTETQNSARRTPETRHNTETHKLSTCRRCMNSNQRIQLNT